MPPKKKKSPKKSGKKRASSGEGSSAEVQIDEPELNKEFFIIHIKDLERKLRLYQEKAEILEVDNDKFSKSLSEKAQEKQSKIIFLKTNLLNRGDELADLRDRFGGLQLAREAEKARYEGRLQEMRVRLQETKDQLTAENNLLAAKLAALEEFKIQKERYLEEYTDLERLLVEKREEHEQALEGIRQKQAHDRDLLKKEIVARINYVAAEFRKASQKQTSDTTKRTIRENVSIRTQLTKMGDRAVELATENEQMRQKVRERFGKMRALVKTQNELAERNSSHTKLLHMLIMKQEEHQEIIESYQKETNIIQKIEEENERLEAHLGYLQEERNSMRTKVSQKQEEAIILEKEYDDIKENTDQAKIVLVEAVCQLKRLLQTYEKNSSAVSRKSTGSRKSISQVSMRITSGQDTIEKEWGNFQQRQAVEDQLQRLLYTLETADTDSRISFASVGATVSRSRASAEFRNISPSVSIEFDNSTSLRRVTPVLTDHRRQQRGILSEEAIRREAKFMAIKQRNGYCVPGLLQMVPSMNKHIQTFVEKTKHTSDILNGTNAYRSESDIDKPTRPVQLSLLLEAKSRFLADGISG